MTVSAVTVSANPARATLIPAESPAISQQALQSFVLQPGAWGGRGGEWFSRRLGLACKTLCGLAAPLTKCLCVCGSPRPGNTEPAHGVGLPPPGWVSSSHTQTPAGVPWWVSAWWLPLPLLLPSTPAHVGFALLCGWCSPRAYEATPHSQAGVPCQCQASQ